MEPEQQMSGEMELAMDTIRAYKMLYLHADRRVKELEAELEKLRKAVKGDA